MMTLMARLCTLCALTADYGQAIKLAKLMLHLTLEGARDLWEALSQAASVEAILACMMK